ncbi:mothers against decapentaplegic homolog [Plakobranchus ocellatus]|uniref:Mothers against decapentaplegic homolog n=1 Tax=Plakobranchus ocellatus TaxID=259542 RepID=A0AAV3Z3K8_9GAST|nr:mothers against decapentaplegic homolog [Plakobranchus ocellatus]
MYFPSSVLWKSIGSPGRAVGYQVRGPRFESPCGPSQFFIAPLYPPSTKCESALKCAGSLLSRVRSPPPAPWPDGGPESLILPCCGLVIYINQPERKLIKTLRRRQLQLQGHSVNTRVTSI